MPNSQPKKRGIVCEKCGHNNIGAEAEETGLMIAYSLVPREPGDPRDVKMLFDRTTKVWLIFYDTEEEREELQRLCQK